MHLRIHLVGVLLISSGVTAAHAQDAQAAASLLAEGKPAQAIPIYEKVLCRFRTWITTSCTAVTTAPGASSGMP